MARLNSSLEGALIMTYSCLAWVRDWEMLVSNDWYVSMTFSLLSIVGQTATVWFGTIDAFVAYVRYNCTAREEKKIGLYGAASNSCLLVPSRRECSRFPSPEKRKKKNRKTLIATFIDSQSCFVHHCLSVTRVTCEGCVLVETAILVPVYT